MAVCCRLKQSVTSPAYIDSYHSSTSSDVAAVKSIANEALTRMLSIDKCDITKINPLYSLPDLQFKSTVSLTKVLCICINSVCGKWSFNLCDSVMFLCAEVIIVNIFSCSVIHVMVAVDLL